MSQVENLVHQIQALCSREDDWRGLLQQLESQGEALAANVNSVDQIFAQLNPQAHTLGCLFLLHCKVKGSRHTEDPRAFMNQVKQTFLEGHGGQLKHLKGRTCEVARAFAEVCRTTAQAMFGIRPLLAAIEKVRESPEHLTAIHSDMLQLCLFAKNFKPALPLLDQRILSVSKEKDCLLARDFLLYFYYGGMVYAAVKSFHRALDMFQLAFTMPCHALNEIMVEIHKKYVLVSLIVHGEVQALPKYTASLVQRLLKNCCGEYNEIAHALSTHKVEEVESMVNKHKELLVKDSNYGLAQQALASVYSRNISRLTQTFVTLSLTDIAQQVGLPDADHARRQILDMIDKGQILATIDEQKGMVSFDTEPDKTTSHQLLSRLTNQIQTAMELNEKLRVVDEAISSNPSYLSKVSIQERASRWGDPVPTEWASAGATADEMLDVGEKPPGFNYGKS